MVATKVMSKQSSRLYAAQAERLALLVQGLGKAQFAIGQILRQGYESRHQDGGRTKQALERGLGDVYHAMVRLTRAGDVDGSAITQHADERASSAGPDLHHQAISDPMGGRK